MNDPLTGKAFVITGATSGIGLAAAEALAQRGGAVIGVGRSPERCALAAEQLRTLAPRSLVAYCIADLSIQQQIRVLAQQIRQQLADWELPALDGLINNAGTFTFWQTLTAEGFEMQWAVNYLAGFLLTHELLSLLEAAPWARVVTVSSGSHYGMKLQWNDIQLRRWYHPLRAYRQSKLANVLFTAELNRQMGAYATVRAFAADPGLVNTKIGAKGSPALVRWIWNSRSRRGLSPEASARGVVFLATEPSIQSSPEIYWKHSQPKPADPYALDADAAQRLWKLSFQMCGIQSEEF